MITNSNNKSIRTRSCPNCILCGNKGEFLYQDLADRWCGVKGKWDLRQCPDAACGLVWLDPMPLENEIGKAYPKNYYTHTQDEGSRSWLYRVYYLAQEGYWATKYGYCMDTVAMWKKLFGMMIYLIPLKRGSTDLDVMYLRAKDGGRLLDVGCSNGMLLARMRELGWCVEGMDVDSDAVYKAREKDLTVQSGPLKELDFPENFFDAVTLYHVIEHVHNPVLLLDECRRILKPGGYITVSTPNIESWGHGRVGSHWYALDPPRHLMLMNRTVLEKIADDAGFKNISTHTVTRATYTLRKSFVRKRNPDRLDADTHQRLIDSVKALATVLVETSLRWFGADTGEEVVLLARKSSLPEDSS